MERRKIVYKERTNNHEEIKKMIDKLANINHVNSEDTKNISVTLNLSSVADAAPKKEKPSAQLLKKYAHGELSGAAEAKAGKEGLEGFVSKKYTQGSFNE